MWNFFLKKKIINEAEESFLISCVDNKDGIHETLQNFFNDNFEKSKDDKLVAEALTSVSFNFLLILKFHAGVTMSIPK